MKAHLFVLFIIALFLTACSGSDEGVDYRDDDLIGKWYNTTGNNSNCDKDFVEFKADYNYQIVHYIMVPPLGNIGDWRCMGLPERMSADSYSAGWELKGSKINIFTYNGVNTTIKIIALTPDTLKLENEDRSVSTYTAN